MSLVYTPARWGEGGVVVVVVAGLGVVGEN